MRHGGSAEYYSRNLRQNKEIRLPVHFIELKNLFFKVYYELLK